MKILAGFSLSVIAMASWCAPGLAAPPITPEVFGALPAISDVKVSPDGRTLAMLQNTGADTGVVFYALDEDGARPRGTRLENATARALVWANDDTVLLMVSQSARRQIESRVATLQAWRWLAISRVSLESRVLFRNEPGWYITSAGRLLATLPDDPDHIVLSRWTSRVGSQTGWSSAGTRLRRKDQSGGLSLFRVRLSDSEPQILAAGNAGTEYWVVDGDGAPLARVDLADSGGRSGSPVERHIYARKAGATSPVLVRSISEARSDRTTITLEGLSATTGAMLATASVGDKLAVLEFDMDSGELGALVYRHPDHDVDSLIHDWLQARVRGVRVTDDLPRDVYFDPAEQRLQESLAAAIPGAAPLIWSRSADGRRLVVKAVYSDRPARWFLYEHQARELSLLGSTYPALDEVVVARKEKFDFRSSDGLLIPGYLTVPAGSTRSQLPLIVLPHGGPWARDDQSFDWWSFFYAARGYLVYQPNFRGSSGYGTAFQDAGTGEWGRAMQRDITEGVQALFRAGIADPGRVCIVGGSYGGYAALAGATLTPELYACAVSVNGVASIGDLIASREGAYREFWEARIGPLSNREALHEVSPAHQAHRAKAAILLVHARDDNIVPIGQSRNMASALARSRKPHEFIELRGEDHWLSAAETRIETLRRSIEFIDRHIGQH